MARVTPRPSMAKSVVETPDSWNEITTVLSVDTWDEVVIQDILRNHRTEKALEYDHLLRLFQERVARQATTGPLTKDDILVTVLGKLQMRSAYLTDEHASLVNLILRCEWCDGSAESFDLFLAFIASLLTSQPSYVDSCLRNFVRRFRTIPFDAKPNLDTNSFKSVDNKIVIYYERLHVILSRIINIVPLSIPKMLRFVGEGFPFKLRPEKEHFFYVYNVLMLHRRHPLNRSAIFGLLIKYIVKIELDASQEELNELEVDDDSDDESSDATPQSWKIEQPTAERLDLVMTLIFEYIESFGNSNDDWSQLRRFYHESLPTFENIVFVTHGLTHVQYIWFYMASLSEKNAEDLLRRLSQKILSPSVADVYRKYSVCYVSSYLARAKFIPIRVVIKFIDQMILWVQDYITEYDHQPLAIDRETTHLVFYTVCQNIFYLLTFRHREILSRPKGLLWFKTLNMERVIMCKLNPMKYSQQIVVELFASVTRQFNLLFCYTVIERNKRMAIFSGLKEEADESKLANPLNTFFPFEPYVLKRSKRFVTVNYRTYDEPVAVKDSPVEPGNYRGLIAESDDSEESHDSEDTVDELAAISFVRKSRKRQLSENN